MRASTDTVTLKDLSISHSLLARSLAAAGKVEEAVAEADALWESARRWAILDPNNIEARRIVARTQRRDARLFRDRSHLRSDRVGTREPGGI